MRTDMHAGMSIYALSQETYLIIPPFLCHAGKQTTEHNGDVIKHAGVRATRPSARSMGVRFGLMDSQPYTS